MTTQQVAAITASAAQIMDVLKPHYDKLNDAQGTLYRWAMATEKAGAAYIKGTGSMKYVVETSRNFEAALKEIN